MQCPYCKRKDHQVKAGRNVSGSQRYRCQHCQRNYTPEPKAHGYGDEVRFQAVRMYVDGTNLRRVGRQVGVNHQSVANWVKAYAHRLPPAPVPEQVETAELDELFTFIKHKKTKSTS
jgi:transposase-like protein